MATGRDVSPTQTFQLLVVGLTIGCAYALGAFGFAFIYRVTRYINFAQGHFLVLGGAISIALIQAGAPVLVGILGGTLGTGLMGYLVDLAVVRPVARADVHAVGIATLAVAFVIEGIALKLIGDTPKFMPSLTSSAVLSVRGVRIQWDAVILAAVTVALFVTVAGYLKFSWGGRAMRMRAESRVGSLLQGVPVVRIEALVFSIAGLAGGLGGSLMAPLYSTTFNNGLNIAVSAFTAATVGGLGSLAGAFVGGILVGLVSVFTSYWWGGEAGLLSTVVLLVAVLAVRPSGIFGQRITRVDAVAV
jgi:branched-subunit amino acid ABC-type transport system permease component